MHGGAPLDIPAECRGDGTLKTVSRKTGRRLVVALVVLVTALAAITVVEAITSADAAAPTCESVIADFQARFPRIVKQSGSPITSCVTQPDAGVGDWSGDNRIELNTVLSAQARAAHVTDLGAYWRRGIAHEYGHAWAAHNGLDPPGAEYARLRGFASGDSSNLDEDYAETFAFSLGAIMQHCYGAAPYCFHNSAGPPAWRQITRLRAAGMLPNPR
jgi:hypothetical protein